MADNREHTEALDLDTLRKLCDKATPGPWSHMGWHRAGSDESYAVWQGQPEIAPLVCRTVREKQGWHDAEFIAAARSAVPALIAEVDRLHRQITQLADELASISKLDGTLHPAALAVYESSSRRVRALGQPAPQPVPDNQENTQ